MKKIINIYNIEFSNFKEYGIKKFLILFAYTILLLIGIYFITKNSMDTQTIGNYKGQYYSLSNMTFSNFFHSIAENLYLTFKILLMGFIPIFFGIFLYHYNSFVILASVLAVEQVSDGGALKFLMANFMPHGLLEIVALLYTMVLSINLSLGLWNKIRPSTRCHTSFHEVFYRAAKSYIYIIIPLLFLSACIETFITPFIVSLFI